MILRFEKRDFANQLAQEIATGGHTVIDAIERIIAEWLEDSISGCLRDRIVKAPRATVYPHYYINRFQNLSVLSQEGYLTWYPEVRFSTRLDDDLEICSLETFGLELGSIRYGGGIERQYIHRRKELETQVNHTLRLSKVTIPSDAFAQTINEVKEESIDQPYIANLTVGCERFVDDRIEGFRTVSFDHILSGERKFCSCHFDAHSSMLSDAKSRVSAFVPNSWPHRVISQLECAVYSDGLCHLCISERYGQDAPIHWYGPQIQRHFEPYVDFLVRSTDVDRRTAKAEAKRRLSLSRWVREEELYQMITKLFPARTIRREASPSWLGQQRLDIYLPEIALAIEHQGEQHYFPVDAFGGEQAFEKTRTRDVRKRALCREHGVTVVDIRYDDPLTIASLRYRLGRWIEKRGL